ncbi:MAG: hypothetical protein M3463_07310 [Verrucomicrobiota bacterium]|nr:hypothetical protein [Verrucomicrobiota bacterium]
MKRRPIFSFRLPAKVPFLVALLGLMLGSLLCTVGGIAVAAYLNGRRSTEDLKHQHYRLISQAVSLEVRRLVEPAQRILLEHQLLAARGLLPLGDPEQLGLWMAEGLRARSFLGWLSYSDAKTGRFVGAWRREDGSVVLNQSSPEVDEGRPHERIIEPDGQTRPINRDLQPGYDPRKPSLTVSRREKMTAPTN